MIPARQRPARVSFAQYVLPSSPSPCDGLSPSLSTMLDKTPRALPACAYLFVPCSEIPPELTPFRGFSTLFRVPSPSVSSFHFVQEPLGLPGFIVVSLSACHGLRTPLRRISTPSPISERVLLCCLRCTLKPSASGTELVEAVPALQGARPPLRPTEFSVYAYLTCCSQLPAPQ